jgi:hypothetical protein
MARKPKAGGSKSAHAFGQLERMAGFVRKSAGTSRAVARIARVTGQRAPMAAQVAPPNFGSGAEANSRADGRTAADGSQSQVGDIREIAGSERFNQRLGAANKALNATRTTRGMSSSEIAKKVRPAMDAISRLERSVESGSAAAAIFNANERAIRKLGSNAESAQRADRGTSSRSGENAGAKRAESRAIGFITGAHAASSIRRVTPPPNVSRRAFSELSRDDRGLSNGSGRVGIAIHSSPTVVINASAAGGNLQRDVIGALRAHREELFDQLKRESARRERTHF